MNKGLVNRTACALLVAMAGAAAPVSALAQDGVPKSGDFSLRYTWVNTTTSAFGEVNRGADKGSIRAGGWIAWLMRNDGSSGFGHKMTGKCVAMFGANASGYDVVLGTATTPTPTATSCSSTSKV